MENRIRQYEEYISEKTSSPLGPLEKRKLQKYHQAMVANFQHERLIHLLIMLFFVSVSLGLVGIFAFLTFFFGLLMELLPFYLLSAIVIILTICYIRHYYFLENHIQSLYDYTAKFL